VQSGLCGAEADGLPMTGDDLKVERNQLLEEHRRLERRTTAFEEIPMTTRSIVPMPTGSGAISNGCARLSMRLRQHTGG